LAGKVNAEIVIVIDILLNKTYKVPDRTDSEGRLWYECVYDMHFATRSTGWAVGSRQILHTVDGGRTWTNQFKNQRENYFMVPGRVFAVSPKLCWVLATTSQSPVKCIVTADGGATWTAKRLGAANPSDIFFIDSKRGWLACDDGKMPTRNGRIHSTQDGGQTWVEHQVSLPGKPTNVRFLDTLNGFVVIWTPNRTGTSLFSELFASVDGGHSWQRRMAFKEQVLSLCVLSNGRLFVAGENGLLAMSRDAGKKWTRRITGVSVCINTIRFRGNTVGIAGADEGTLLISLDGGVNWQPARILGATDDTDNIVEVHSTGERRGIIATSTSLRTFGIAKK